MLILFDDNIKPPVESNNRQAYPDIEMKINSVISNKIRDNHGHRQLSQTSTISRCSSLSMPFVEHLPRRVCI